MSDCIFQLTDAGYLHCPNCNQPDMVNRYGINQSRWPPRNCLTRDGNTIAEKKSEIDRRKKVLDYVFDFPGQTVECIAFGCGLTCSKAIERVEKVTSEAIASGNLRKEGEPPKYYCVSIR
jgi:hypothetical protein